MSSSQQKTHKMKKKSIFSNESNTFNFATFVELVLNLLMACYPVPNMFELGYYLLLIVVVLYPWVRSMIKCCLKQPFWFKLLLITNQEEHWVWDGIETECLGWYMACCPSINLGAMFQNLFTTCLLGLMLIIHWKSKYSDLGVSIYNKL